MWAGGVEACAWPRQDLDEGDIQQGRRLMEQWSQQSVARCAKESPRQDQGRGCSRAHHAQGEAGLEPQELEARTWTL